MISDKMDYSGGFGRTMREVKVCLLGDTGVGKSSLVLRFVSNRFDHKCSATIGASFMSKSIDVGGETIKFQIWDTAGQERYKALAPMYYRGAAAAIVVYDITSESTFNCMKNWVKELSQFGPKDIKIAVAGNKCDLEDAREVSKDAGREYADHIDAIFIETSALTAQNVEEIFTKIGKALPPEVVKYPGQTLPKRDLYDTSPGKRSGSCCN